MPHTPYSTPTMCARASRSGRRLAAARWLAAGVVGAVVTAVLATPQLALAHAKLRSSSPSAGSTVTTAPRELRLTFSEKPELAFTRITLLAGKETIALGKGAADAKSATTVVVPVAGRVGPGSYTVRWRVAGRDGHPINGAFAFTVARAE